VSSGGKCVDVGGTTVGVVVGAGAGAAQAASSMHTNARTITLDNFFRTGIYPPPDEATQGDDCGCDDL